ncbi:MAG: ornithine cyclodeaminase family protein [Cucumibacter sp.]
MLILTDRDLADPPIPRIRDAIARTIAADARGEAVAPPRHIVDFGTGGLIFTIGGAAGIAGFRAYQSFAKPGNPADIQIVAAWDQRSAELIAVAIGNRLGALRTGCIGGVAVGTLSSHKAKILAVIGTGRQAEAQLIGVPGTRAFTEIRLWGRHLEAARALAGRVQRFASAPITMVESAEAAVRGADVVILATTATQPFIEPEWISPLAHVTTLGPQRKDGHELPLALAGRAAVIATDSPRQLAAMGDAHMLAGTEVGARVGHLGELIGAFDPDKDRGITLFLSIGLAGTEVAALAAIAENAS